MKATRRSLDTIVLRMGGFLLLGWFFGSLILEAQEEANLVLPEEPAPLPETSFDDINEYVSMVRSGFGRSVTQADAQREEDLDELNERYLEQLEQVQRFFNESGNAKAALTTRNEIDRIRTGEGAPAPLEENDLERLSLVQDRYLKAKSEIDNAFYTKISQLIEVGEKALEKRASELTRQGDLDRVEALTELMPLWTGRPDLVKEAGKTMAMGEAKKSEDFLEGKRINYPHESKPDSIVSMIFHGAGKATYVGLGGVERPWSYREGNQPGEYEFWMNGRPDNNPDWVYTFQVNPDERSGTVSKGPKYKVEAKIRG